MSYQTAGILVLIVFCAFWAGFWLNNMMTVSGGKDGVGTESYSPDLQRQIDTMNERSDELLNLVKSKGGNDGISQ